MKNTQTGLEVYNNWVNKNPCHTCIKKLHHFWFIDETKKAKPGITLSLLTTTCYMNNTLCQEHKDWFATFPGVDIHEIEHNPWWRLNE
jgi:hypothetical protein